ncbi:hypothetical protein CGLO_17620 [Colletotrichum gloeosporioides Cg-14]|uniref:Uncharacterized protein n=1 Tax=Colletotrichum gloeosporioides (strain Cg-14) TaxID=1237896 RepID=T0L5Y7_COLGC|nr:hypothetical protein CGLO_17620 [Colletotrichum gloeosporioides Cg-14]
MAGILEMEMMESLEEGDGTPGARQVGDVDMSEWAEAEGTFGGEGWWFNVHTAHPTTSEKDAD